MNFVESIESFFYTLNILFIFSDLICGYFIYGAKYFQRKSVCDKIANKILGLGVVYIKLAQWVSCTENGLPKELVDSLVKLQSSVPYEPSPISLPVHEMITYINPVPIGVGSIASVHECTLNNKSGKYVIKIIDTKKHQKLIRNCRQVYNMLCWIKRTFLIRSLCFDVQDILNEMIHQCDLEKEAQNMKRMQKFIDKSPYLKIPNVIHVDKQWMIQEYCEGVPLEKIRTETPEYFADYCTKLYGFFNNMCFDFYFMHADIHDGNSLYELNTGNPDKSRVILLDFGFCIDLTKDMADSMERFQIAMIENDMDEVCNVLPNFFSPKKTVILDRVALRKIWKDHIGDQMTPDKFVAEKIPQILLDICNHHQLEFNHFAFYWVLNNQLLLKNTFYVDDFGERIMFPIMKGTISVMKRDDWNLPSRFNSESDLAKCYERNKGKLFK